MPDSFMGQTDKILSFSVSKFLLFRVSEFLSFQVSKFLSFPVYRTVWFSLTQPGQSDPEMGLATADPLIWVNSKVSALETDSAEWKPYEFLLVLN